MKTKNYILLALLVYSISSTAQAPPWAWAKSATGTAYDEGYAVCSDLNGNVYVAGNFESGTLTFGSYPLTNAGPRDFFLVKYDPSGTVLWAQSFGGSGYDGVEDICVDPSGNIILTGFYNSSPLIIDGISLPNSGGSDMFVVKFDPTGNAIWANRAGSGSYDDGYGVITDNNGNVFVVGIFQSSTITFGGYTLNNGGDNDVYLVKYDSGGVAQWAKRAGGSSWDNGFGVGTDGLGNAYISGYFGSSTMTFDGLTVSLSGGSIFLAKYDPLGNALWAVNDGGSGVDLNAAVSTDQSGNSYITGYFTSSTAFFGIWPLSNSGGADIYIAKYDASGGVVWAKRAGGSGSDVGYDVTHDGNGNTYLTGYFGSSSVTFETITLNSTGGPDVYVTKYDNTGAVPWAVNPSGGVDDIGRGIYSDANGNVYAAGAFYSASITFGNITLNNTGNWDVYIAKMGTCNIAQPTITPNGPTSFCVGGSVTLTSSPATNYSWSNGATTQAITVLSSGLFTVIVSDGPGCSATSAPVTVTVYPNPQPIINPTGPTTFCNGGSVVLTCSSADSYLWSTGETNQSIIASYTDNICVQVMVNGCAGMTCIMVTEDTVSLAENHQDAGCGLNNGMINLFVTDGIAPFSFSWSNGANTEDLVNIPCGNYSVTVTDAAGCSASLSVTISCLGAIVLSEAHVNVPCFLGNNGSINLTASGGTPGYTYYWSNSETTEDIQNLTAGIYSVIVLDASFCSASLSVTITQPADSVTVLSSVSNVSCYGGNDGAVVLSVFGGTPPYTWNPVIPDPFAMSAGVYSVTATDANGCTAVEDFIVNQPYEITVSIFSTADNGGCTGTATADVAGGTAPFNYLWNNGATTDSTGGLCGDSTYTVTVTDNYDCTTTGTVNILSTGIKDIFSSFITIYPNPTARWAVITVQSAVKENIELIVFDILGKEIYKTSFTGDCQLLTARWGTGIYYLQLRNENGTVTKKLVVQR